MCGISLVINSDISECKVIAEAISNRGSEPTVYTSVGNSVVGYTRLPITDRHAPQVTKYKDSIVWLNGFISNYRELADKYDIRLDTECDTELLVKFLYRFNLDKLDELNGFFSVVYYNGEFNCFTDRYGIKQLYKYTKGDSVYICSEVKGILALFDLEPDYTDWKHSLGVMTDSIYKDIELVENLPFNKPDKIDISYNEAKTKLNQLWKQSVKRNYYSGAGVMLSGGVDSGLIAKDFEPEYSFSMDYQGELSEIDNIKLNSIGKHYTIIHNDKTFKEFAPKTKIVLDEPKVGSCYTNFALMELASKFCKVVYSGAGADEIFNGYTHRYNKPINEVIKRTNYPGKEYDITHNEYDWRFLKGILVVEDRLAGWHTLETRYPFLDNDLVDFALSLPDEYLNNKRILKDISELPQEITEGKKRGFSNPITNKDWVDYLT